VSNLFTREFFALARRRLAPIRNTDLVLVGAEQPIRLDPAEIERRLGRPAVRADLERVGIRDAADLLARGRLGPAELATLVGDEGPENTDDNARIEFAAPLDLYRETADANEWLIERVARGLAPYLVGAESAAVAAFSGRLARAYADLGLPAEARAAWRRAND
jgi:hypothetical protein